MKVRPLAWLTLGTLILLSAPVDAQPASPSCRDVDFQEPCVLICPATSITATANDNGSITVHALVNDTADLYRSEAGADPELVFGFAPEQTTYLDVNTTLGLTYTYYLVIGSALCAQVEVTSIPVFGSPFAIAGAAGLGAIAYAVGRRRH